MITNAGVLIKCDNLAISLFVRCGRGSLSLYLYFCSVCPSSTLLDYFMVYIKREKK